MPTADQFKSVLQRHVLDLWFPRCLDLEYGGFLCDFNDAWESVGSNDKLLEFQARQTWLAAEANLMFPEDERLRKAAIHGFRYLRDVMWDNKFGGWFHRMDRSGKPLEANTKHSHGIAYAISACAVVHEATSEPGALDLADEAFEWLEKYAHDNENGGYFGLLLQDGKVVRNESECPWPGVVDTKETPIGFKDSDVHSDFLETFTYLGRVSFDAKIKERLAEVITILCDRMTLPSGALHYYCYPDWTPVPHFVRFGITLQTAFRLLGARSIVGNLEKINDTAGRLTDHTLRFGWDTDFDGFFYAGPGTDPVRVAGKSLLIHTKSWWVQAEGLKALFALNQLHPENADYLKYFLALWNYMQRYFIDHRHGGFYMTGLDVLSRWRRKLGSRVIPANIKRKGSAWKDGSHDGRALLYLFQMLNKPKKEISTV
ncbi:MAG TPA: AGE family epimerase/isomerase [Acidobacteriota bacterium]|nr:AGE family epimerase/isomerase [Acidobacteriota bacterium]